LWATDANTNTGFEPLIEFEKVKAKHSKCMKYEVTGGHFFHWQENMRANERSPQHVKESTAKVARILKNCGFITPSDINGEVFKN